VVQAEPPGGDPLPEKDERALSAEADEFSDDPLRRTAGGHRPQEFP
jgi:hypothetical protein